MSLRLDVIGIGNAMVDAIVPSNQKEIEKNNLNRNSMNLIDGVDGLSSGIFIIFCLSILILLEALPAIHPQYFILISIFLGSMIAFFIINYPPAKIFLGDAGSQLLGWIMALSIVHISSFFEFNYQRLYLFSFISIPFYDVL